MNEVVSINVSLPREVRHGERTIRTGIFKAPVRGPVRLRRGGFEGDGQADLENHGGPDKAACIYSRDHYPHWETELGRSALPWGQFGENVTVAGLVEDAVRIGDVFELGSARVEVTQPRAPCFKLGLRMEAPDFPKRFLRSLRTGFYVRVLEEGEVEAGDSMRHCASGPEAPSVREACRLLHFARSDLDGVRRALRAPALSADWRRAFEALLEQAGGRASPDRRAR